MNHKIEYIQEFYQKVKASRKEFTKKEAFKDLLNRLYANSSEILLIIDKMTLGAETTILNIPRQDKLHVGSADTLFNNIIIEFENDLKTSEKHAKEQLAGYMLGQFHSGKGYNFTLILSDFINWKIVAPDLASLEKLDTILEHELVLNEIESASFVLNENNSEDFFYWLDRFLFKEEKQKATLQKVEDAFGCQSPVFIESFRILQKALAEAKKYGSVQVSFEQWYKFLSIAYGSFEISENIFLIHTYLSVFAKMLAYAVVSNEEFIDDSVMRKILNGTIFHAYNITNFVDNDFFHWVNEDRDYHNLKKVFRLIAQEISAFDFTDVDEDILKGVYQELIDLDTRQSLGEYYTPDWLCERIVQEYDFAKSAKILDPACGSGSFLRAAIHRLKDLEPDLAAEDINQQIYGIDIHPLSVQIAKTTILLALGKEISQTKKPIHLNIVLANTLLAPEGVKDLFGNEFMMYIDKEQFSINTQVLEDVEMFDSVLDICEELAQQTMHDAKMKEDNFEKILKKQTLRNGYNLQLLESFYKIYLGLKAVKEKGRDSIWKFILSNLYKPYFLNKKFDYIIGNPPWFTYSSIKNEDYQNILDSLSERYSVKPVRVANFPHLEIAAIFQAHCSSYFLKDLGKMALVLPRSFFSADHHENTRSGIAKGFTLTAIWDLENVTPLFRIPSCVFFSDKEKETNGKSIKKPNQIKGKKFTGRLPYHNCNLLAAKNKLTETSQTFYYVTLGKTTAFSTKKNTKSYQENPYRSQFKQGATIVPRAFYFVELNQPIPPDFDDRIINIKTDESVKADFKANWNGLEFSDRIESDFLFRTALAKSILPFALFKPSLVVLPIQIEKNSDNQKVIKLFTSETLRNTGYIYTAKWFMNVERIWKMKRTEKNRIISLEDYLNWHSKLTEQNLNAKYLVLYNSSAKDANAMIVDRTKIDFEFIVESKAYVFYTDNINEANYLTAFLNSSIPNLLIKDFQTRGLFGPRDIHKKILDVYFPAFNENNSNHLKLAELGSICHTKADVFLQSNLPEKKLTSFHLGRLRLEIKEHLAEELALIDGLVKKIMQ
jgi:antitoxin component of RelBE/YafQ-DinJ toxin-antitoxin module